MDELLLTENEISRIILDTRGLVFNCKLRAVMRFADNLKKAQLAKAEPLIYKAGYEQGKFDAEIEMSGEELIGKLEQARKEERERIYYAGFETCPHKKSLKTCNKCWQALEEQ